MTNYTSYTTTEYLKDLADYIKPYKKLFFAGTFSRFTSDLAGLFPAWALSQWVSIFSGPINEGVIQRSLILLIIFFLLSAYRVFFHEFAKYFGNQVAEKVGLDAKLQGLKHIYNLDIAWQEKESGGNKLKRINHGSMGLNETIRMFFKLFMESILNIFAITLIFFSQSIEIGLILITFIFVYFLVSVKLTKRASHQAYVVNKEEEKLEGISFESLNNIRTIKSLGISEYVVRQVSARMDSVFHEVRERIKLFRFRNGVLNAFYYAFRFIGFAVIIYYIIQGRFDVGFLVLFSSYLGKVEEAAFELSEVAHEVVINKIRMQRLKEILNEDPSVIDESGYDYPTGWDKIEIRGLSFKYGSSNVLQDINLTINRGEKIGIVGLSGAGKSTLFKLLLDLYEDYEGDILIGGKSLKQISRKSYIENLSVVLQETELFNLSLLENIKLASSSSSVVSVQEAVKIAHLQEVIEKLPQGLDSIIGEKGVKLSGGEKQRLGIARAIYRNPDILLMDEATSHLDVSSERKIQDALHEFFRTDITAIVIAHRLSTIKEMDRIVVLQAGKIVEEGNFSELIDKKGAFADLWEKQRL